ncbi:MAG: redox-regulated ATPase YchF [Spirochaetales bacterium]|nr:redox-regulated ATPase YchF [Spirochaetales bacterium]
MALNCGIVGLPNVGKSTIFSALTSARAEAANYPFCTIEPNVGIVSVPDKRLGKILSYIQSEKVIPAIVEFVDIAGLVKGASKGEGLGNKFLANIRETGILCHVVRCFEDDDIVHVANKIDPISDIEVINTELALADLETVGKKIEKNKRLMKSASKIDRTEMEMMEPVLQELEAFLSEGKPARALTLTEDQQKYINQIHLITSKKQIYLCNVDEDGIAEDNQYVKAVKEYAKGEGSEVSVICGKLESEIAVLETVEEKNEFLEAVGLEESGLSKLIRIVYQELGLRTYFTAGPKEIRAWTFQQGWKAPQAAGVIHTDFERGFIKAEVYHCEDLFTYETEQKVKTAGKLRLEGKDYIVKDGDIMHFKFNV